MAFRKIEAGLVHADVDQFIGKTGTIFYDNSLGDFRISNGSTPGGIPLSFGQGGGNYVLPTATTSVKGGVKIDGSTITILNQVISVGTVPYSSLSGTPTIPTNTNQLTNGAGFITSGALSTYALSSSVPTNNNQLSNGAGYITSAALSGLATENYVNTRGFLTTISYADVTNKPTLFSGSYADLTNKPTIPTDINQLTDASGLLGQGGGGTTNITNNIENPFSFSIAGDDSTLREIASGESIKITGAGGITVTTDAEGTVTVTGPSLVGYATENYVNNRGFLTTISYADVTNKPTIPTDTNQLANGAGYITNTALSGLASENYVNTRGFLTTVSFNDLTEKPNLAGTYSWSIAADDSTQRQVNADNLIKFIGGQGIITSSDSDGNITITSTSALTDRLTNGNKQAVLNTNGTFSLPILSAEPVGLSTGQIALANGVNWDPLGKQESKPYLALYSGTAWIEIGGITASNVYAQILELA